jgi:hypothetical protein
MPRIQQPFRFAMDWYYRVHYMLCKALELDLKVLCICLKEGFITMDGQVYFVEPVRNAKSRSKRSLDPNNQPHRIHSKSRKTKPKCWVSIFVSLMCSNGSKNLFFFSADHKIFESSLLKRQRRSLSIERFIEVLAVVDKTMLAEFKIQNRDIESYILTVFSMVTKRAPVLYSHAMPFLYLYSLFSNNYRYLKSINTRQSERLCK